MPRTSTTPPNHVRPHISDEYCSMPCGLASNDFPIKEDHRKSTEAPIPELFVESISVIVVKNQHEPLAVG